MPPSPAGWDISDIVKCYPEFNPVRFAFHVQMRLPTYLRSAQCALSLDRREKG